MTTHYTTRLDGLRQQMTRMGVDGYLIPISGPFLGEYAGPSDARLEWLTGFTGSNGIALVLKDHALICSDARYTLQLQDQVDKTIWTTADIRKPGVVGWLDEEGIRSIKIGYDPSLHAAFDIDKMEKELEPFQIVLHPIRDNLVNLIWTSRPPVPHTGVEPFLDVYAGETALQKIDRIAQGLKDKGHAAAFLSDPSDLAWLLNVRGRDLPHTPVALSCGVIYADKHIEWVIDPLRVPLELKKNLNHLLQVTPPESIDDTMMRIKAKVGAGSVLVDRAYFTAQHAQMFEFRNIAICPGASPIAQPRAIKSSAEQSSTRDAHKKDAVALIRFLSWLDTHVSSGDLDELSVAEELLRFRELDPAFRGNSFGTIAAFGPHGALPHYQAVPETNARLLGDTLLLLDSGGQYVGGTTDITRTIAVGTPTDDMCRDYTAVLQAHIAVATATFPVGTRGAHLDSLARNVMWRHGIDFSHRLGHGIGCFMGVHEPAVTLSQLGTDIIEKGMYISNEPAYYRMGEYGIRLENDVIVVESDMPGFLKLDTVSLVPFDPVLTKLSLMTADEKEWLAVYHTRILEVIGPLLPQSDREWLEAVVDYFC